MPPLSLLVFIRKPEITLFSPWHHFLPRFIFARHSPCKSKAFDLCTFSCNGLNIKFNFAAVEVCLPRAQPWHGEPGRRPPRGNSLHPPQYAKATFEWNICLVSEQSSVCSLHTDTWKWGAEEKALAPDCNKAASLIMVAHWNEACWVWVAEQSVSLVTITAL